MDNYIKLTKEALTEASTLSGEILLDLELGRISISDAALKSLRLARILNDFTHEKIFQYEFKGYPADIDGVKSDIWELGILADRVSCKAPQFTPFHN